MQQKHACVPCACMRLVPCKRYGWLPAGSANIFNNLHINSLWLSTLWGISGCNRNDISSDATKGIRFFLRLSRAPHVTPHNRPWHLLEGIFLLMEDQWLLRWQQPLLRCDRGATLSIYMIYVCVLYQITPSNRATRGPDNSSLCGGSECVCYVCSSLCPSSSSRDKNAVVAGPADPWSAVRQRR